MNEPIEINITQDHLTLNKKTTDDHFEIHLKQLVAKHNLRIVDNPKWEHKPFLYGDEKDLYWFLYDVAYHYDILLV